MLLHHKLAAPELAVDKRPEVSVLRAITSLIALALVVLAVAFLADWAKLGSAMKEFGGHPWLLIALVIIYTVALWLRAVAWRALIAYRTGLYGLFVSIQAGMLVNHIAPR